MKGAEYDDNNSIGGVKTNYLTVDNYICNPCRVRSCKTKRYRGYNRVVYTLDHMRIDALIAELQDVKAMMNGTYPFEKGRIREQNLDFDTFMHRP